MKQEGFLNLNKLFGGIYLITGGVMVGSGILLLAIPSGAERKLEKVQNMSDLVRKERMCHDALSSLAKTGRRNRIVGGILASTFAAYYFAHALKEESKQGNRAYELG